MFVAASCLQRRIAHRLFAVLASAAFLSAAALPSLAQHPAVANSVLLDANGFLLGFDATGNGVEYPNSPGATLRVFRPDGTIVSQIPLLSSAQQIAFDGSGNLYALSPRCATTCPAPTTTFGTGSGAVLFGKVNATGDAFVWLDRLTDVSPNYSTAMRVDVGGNVYLAGSADCSFPTSAGSFQPQCAPNNASPAFAAKVDSTGTKLLYATFLRGTTQNAESLTSMAIDGSGSMYVIGQAASDWPTTPGAFEPTANNPTPTFVAKLKSDGSGLTYSTFLNEDPLGGTCGEVVCTAIAVDSQGSAYLAGQTTNTAFPTTSGAAEPTFPIWAPQNGTPDPSFVTKFKPDGTGLVYSTYVSLLDQTTFSPGGSPGILVDSAGDAFVYGLTKRPGVQTVNAIQGDDNHPNAGEGAIAELSPQGSGYVFSTYLGGTGGANDDNGVIALEVATDGSIHIAGYGVGDDFPALASTSNQYPFNPVLYIMTLQPSGTNAVPIMFSTDSVPPVNPGGSPGALQATLAGACAGPSCASTANGTMIPRTSQGTVYLGNYGAAPLTIGSITTSGDFSQANACPVTLAAGARCIVTVTFMPAVLGTRTGTLTLTGSGPTQTMSLSSFGYAAQVQTTASTLGFGVQAVGTSSAPQTLTITNTGNFELDFTSISVQGEFSQTNNCGAPVNANGGTCAVQVTFTPTASSQQSGTLTLASNAINGTVVLQLEGGINPDFSIALPQGGTTTQTVTAGQTATFNLSLTPLAGFSGTVALSCSGAPPGGGCVVSPPSASLSGSSAVAFTVSIATTAQSVGSSPVLVPPSAPPLRYPRWLWLWVLSAFLVSLWHASRTRRFPTATNVLCALALFATLFTTGCGGGTSSSSTPRGTPPGTYTITVNASSGSDAHTENLTVIVQ
ncbi:MAG TPA: choice-of-anchor D domain-containing protein [Candidatus Acidoferrales bacterium]|nr:choice-of-anchor D domain-containing protein [Candidatus Acidoferrales bacterium]